MFSRQCLEKPCVYVLEAQFISHCCYVVFQLFSTGVHAIDVTQASFAGERSTQPAGPAAKKRRLESGWQALRQAIIQHGHRFTVIPWYANINVCFSEIIACVPVGKRKLKS